MSKKDTYLITGGCGFIGSAVIRHLLKNNNNIVINIDKLSYASNVDAVEASQGESYIFIKDDIINNVVSNLLDNNIQVLVDAENDKNYLKYNYLTNGLIKKYY